MRVRLYFTVGAIIATSAISSYLLWLLFTDASRIESLGLGGIFLASMLSHTTMVARDIFVPLFLSLTPFYNPLMLGTAAAIGGALGDVTPYALGLAVAQTVKHEENKTEDLVSKWIKKYGLWAILAVAMTPLPDLPVIMLAGTRKLPFKKLLVIEAAGKTILYSAGAFFGGWVFSVLIGVIGSLFTSALMLVASITFCVVLTWPPSRDYIFSILERFIPSG